MYGTMLPSRKDQCDQEPAVLRRMMVCQTTLTPQNTQGKSSVAFERRIRHLPICLRRFQHKKIETNSRSSLAGRESLRQTQRCIIPGFALSDPQLRRLECVALCLFSSYACCLRFFTRSKKLRLRRLQLKRPPLRP